MHLPYLRHITTICDSLKTNRKSTESNDLNPYMKTIKKKKKAPKSACVRTSEIV